MSHGTVVCKYSARCDVVIYRRTLLGPTLSQNSTVLELPAVGARKTKLSHQVRPVSLENVLWYECEHSTSSIVTRNVVLPDDNRQTSVIIGTSFPFYNTTPYPIRKEKYMFHHTKASLSVIGHSLMAPAWWYRPLCMHLATGCSLGKWHKARCLEHVESSTMQRTTNPAVSAPDSDKITSVYWYGHGTSG